MAKRLGEYLPSVGTGPESAEKAQTELQSVAHVVSSPTPATRNPLESPDSSGLFLAFKF